MTEIWLSAKEIAALCGVAERTVRDWASKGQLFRRSENEYDAIAAVQRLVAELKQQQGNTAVRDLQLRKLAAQTAKLEAEAGILELDLGVKKGELVETNKVQQDWLDLIARTKTRLLGLPAAIAPQLAAENVPAIIQKILTDHITKALIALSNDLAS